MSWVHLCQDKYRVAAPGLSREQQPPNLYIVLIFFFFKVIKTFIAQVHCGMQAIGRVAGLLCTDCRHCRQQPYAGAASRSQHGRDSLWIRQVH